MKISAMAVVVSMVAGAVSVPTTARAAEAVNCVDQYLGCINVASQETGFLWRTAKEFECGIDYWACMRDKADA